MEQVNEQKLGNPLGYAPVGKLLKQFALPAVISMLVNALYNIVDQIFIGQGVGYLGNAATTVAFPIVTIVLAVSTLLGAGGSSYAAIKLGEKKEKEAERTLGNVFALLVVIGVVCAAIGLIFLEPILKVFGATPNNMSYAKEYASIILLGTPFNMLGVGLSNLCRTDGSPKFSMYSMLIGAVLNTILDPVYIFVFHWGVTGAAIATIASQFFSAILTLIALLRTQDSYRLIVSKIRFHRDLLFDIIKIGLPAGLQSAMYSISNLLIQSSINSFGTDTIAAWTAYGKVDSIFWMIMGAYGVSITTFAGQNFGAGKYDRIKKSVRICLGLAAVTSLFLSFIVLNFGGTILLLFTRDANVINICIGMMRVVSPAYITYICIEILSGTCRGCGDSFFPMLLTCFGVCVLRILWITIAVPLRHEVATVAFSYPLTWTITSILFILYYKRGKWMQKDTLRNAPQGQGKDA